MVASRSAPKLPRPELAHEIPIFLDQVVKPLTIEQRTDLVQNDLVSSNSGAGSDCGVGAIATLHRRDVCQTVTNLTVEKSAPISADEFRTFNRFLDDAIAGAVTEYSQHKAPTEADRATINASAHSVDGVDLETALLSTAPAASN